MNEPHTASVLTQSTAQSWARVGTLVVILMASILAPFALWGDLLDAQAPLLLEQNQRPLAIAVIGISLLIADIGLPIPSSVVGIAMCWLLGPWWGGVALAVGLTLSFACGMGSDGYCLNPGCGHGSAQPCGTAFASAQKRGHCGGS